MCSAAGGAEAGGERAAHPVQTPRELPHPAQDKKEMTILPPEKIGRYLQEAEKYVLPMFYLELSSGLRRGELLALSGGLECEKSAS